MAKRASLLGPLMLMAGCAVGPDYIGPPELNLPSHWSQKSSATRDPHALGEWWLRLRDPVLGQLIKEAIEAYPTVAKAKAAVREARATLNQTSAGLFPSVTGSGLVTNNKVSSHTVSVDAGSFGPIQIAPYNLYQAGFDSSWELDLFGTHRGVEAALRSEQASEQDLRNSLFSLIGDVAAYYIDTRDYQARIALARRTSASQRDTERLTRGKYDAGSGTAMDLAKATAQAASTEANIPSYQASLAAGIHRLSILIGRPPGATRTLLASSSPCRSLNQPAEVKAAPKGVCSRQRLAH
jgi:multidrug efflux system outer membrane protein